MMYTEPEQIEMTDMPERSSLGEACKKFLDVKGRKKDLDAEEDSITADIILKMQDEGRSYIVFNGWEFEMDTPKVKLKIHAVKGRAKLEQEPN